MSDRYDTITVTLEEPLREEYVERLCQSIRLLDGVVGVEPGRVESMALHTARMQLRHEAFEAWEEVFDL